MNRRQLWQGIIAVTVGAIGLLTPRPASAIVTIISDTCTAADNTPMTSHAPDINLPGGAYVSGNSPNRIGGSTNGGTPASVSNASVVGTDGAWAISLASAGGYTKPNRFTIAADLNLCAMQPGVSEPDSAGETGIVRGITLGFFTDASTSTNLFNERRSPLGVTYNDGGKLLLVVPNPSGILVLAAVSTYGPSNDPIPVTGTHNLVYEVNTTTGNISNVMFDGFAINFGVTATQFTNLATSYAGNYAGSGSGNTFGSLDNFTVVDVTPEPSSALVIALGAATLGVRRRRRQEVLSSDAI